MVRFSPPLLYPLFTDVLIVRRMCVQEGNLFNMRETDPGYFWVPHGKQMSRVHRRNGLDSGGCICIPVLHLIVYV